MFEAVRDHRYVLTTWAICLLVCAGCGDPQTEPPQPIDMSVDVGADSGPEMMVGCEPGFEPGGSGCVDIDECRVDAPCDPLVICTNLTGGFTCGACPDGYAGTGLEGCTLSCEPGFHDGGDGQCVPTGGCSPGFVLGEDGSCGVFDCPDGQHFDGVGACVPEGECAEGFVIDDAGHCVPRRCPPGQHDDGTGACAPEGTCAPGHVLDDDDCVRLSCPADDANEPDDDLEPDRTLPADGLEGIACAGDADVFALDPGDACRAIVQLTIIDGAPTVTLRDAGGGVLAEGAPVDDGLEARSDLDGLTYVDVGGAGIYRLSVEYAGHDGGDGACVDRGRCSPGWALDDDAACTRCADDFHDGGDGGCLPEGECAPGFALGGGGVCVPRGECAAGFRDDGTGACASIDAGCAAGFSDDGAGRCTPPTVCAEGFAIDRLDVCRELRDCGDEVDNRANDCQSTCSAGYQRGGGDPWICLPLGDCQPGALDRGDGVCAGQCLRDFVQAGDACVMDYACPADDPIEAEERDAPAELVDGVARHGIACPGDVDHFKLDPPSGCSARVVLRFDPTEGALTLEAGPEGESVPAVDAPGGQRLVLEGLDESMILRVRGDDPVRYALRIDIDGHDGGDGVCRPLAECSVGWATDGDGACSVCAEGYVDDGQGVCVLRGQCADEFHDGGDGVCVPENECSPGYADGNGATPGVICVAEGQCAGGFHDGNGPADGVPCVPVDACSAGFHDGNGPAGPGVVCLPVDACSAGFHDGGDGVCVALDDCSPGFHDGNGAEPGNPCLPEGECGRGLHDGGDGICVGRAVCSPGYLDRGDGMCTENAALQTDCLAGREFVFVEGGRCACRFGTRDGGDGVCVDLDDSCSPGFRLASADGHCVPVADCDPDHHATPWGECRPTADCDGMRDDGIGGCVALDGRCAEGFFDRGGICAAPPYCAPGYHDGGDGRCVPEAGCAPGFVRAAAGCVPDADDADACAGFDFDRARPLEDGPPASGAVCDRVPDTLRFELDHRCGFDIRLVADDRDRVVDLALFDDARNPIAVTEAVAGRARIRVDERGPRAGFVQVVPVEPGAARAAGYRVDLVRDPLRCAPCPDGSTSDGAGRCIPPANRCAPGYRDGGSGACVPVDRCSPGFRDGGDGRCVPFDTCGAGHALNAVLACVPQAMCADGLRDDGTGMCRASCADGFGYRDGGDGTCVAAPYCSAGFDDDGAGRCIERLPGAACAPTHAADPSGLCLAVGCPDGGDASSGVADAQRLAVDLDGVERLHASLCPGDTGDWYEVQLDGTPLRARLRFHHGSNDMALRILDLQGDVLAEADSDDDDEVTGIPGTGGSVLVEVTGDGRNAGYRLDLVRQ